MEGKIVKGIAGFYYVNVRDKGVYECKAKGVFRNRNIKPLVGDNVELEVIDDNKFLGNIVSVLPRKNYVLRPEVANVDQAIIIFAATNPEPNINLLSRFLIRMEMEHIDTIICFNKNDLADEKTTDRLSSIFKDSGSNVIFTNTMSPEGMKPIYELLENKTTVLAGPSGVGKSSITNILIPEANMQTGTLSEKIQRGKHTTRHSELFCIDDGRTFVFDTPGFTTLYVNELEAKELRLYYNEFAECEGKCRFNGCVHVSEPDCRVKELVADGVINQERYDTYIEIYNELKNIKRY